MRFYLALLLAKVCAALIRLIAKNRGTNLPGELALKLDPMFVAHIKRVDPAKAYASLRDEGFLPLHLDEITTGKIFNTLAMQAFLDRFNLIFQGIAEPVDGEVSDKILKDIFAPFWKQYHDGILYLMNDGTEPPKA